MLEGLPGKIQENILKTKRFIKKSNKHGPSPTPNRTSPSLHGWARGGRRGNPLLRLNKARVSAGQQRTFAAYSVYLLDGSLFTLQFTLCFSLLLAVWSNYRLLYGLCAVLYGLVYGLLYALLSGLLHALVYGLRDDLLYALLCGLLYALWFTLRFTVWLTLRLGLLSGFL